MQQVGKVRSATQAAAAPLVQKASDGVKALLKLVSSSESDYFKEGEVHAAEIRQQLASPNTETKLVGLRRAIAAEAACGSGEYSEAPSLFFAEVLKNLSTSDFELKRLVYLYLVQHAQQHPDLTLLSINGYQKDLYSASHVVRAAALKSLSSLSMLEIVQLLLYSLKRAAADTSPLVRKTAAHAAAKIYFLDTDQREEIVATLLQLLGDGEIAVLGAALVSFRLIFFQSLLMGAPGPGAPLSLLNGGSPHAAPDLGAGGGPPKGASDSQEEALALLHPFYSRLVQLLPQLQPGPQVVAIDLLARYCRCFFSQPQAKEERQEAAEPHAEDTAKGAPRVSSLSLLASRGMALQQQQQQQQQQQAGEGSRQKPYLPLPEDFEGFKQALDLMLLSDSVAVVVSACAAIQSLFPACCWDCVVHPLLRCLYTCPSDEKEVVLRVISAFVTFSPRLFQPHMREFYLKQSDAYPVRQQKLSLLFALAVSFPASLSSLLPEFRVYLHWAGDGDLISSVFRVLTSLALRYKQAQIYCMRLFVSLLDSASASVAAEAVVGVRTLVQQKQEEQDEDMLARLVLHLAAQLNKITSPAARASIVWVVAKYHQQVSWVAADVLRQLVKRFKEEADDVKLQILLLATRLWGFHLRNMHEGPEGPPAGAQGPPAVQTPQGDAPQQQAEQRLIPPPTREQSRQHFPRLGAMLHYLFEASLYDSSHDVRDMARTYSTFASAVSEPEETVSEAQRDMRRFAAKYLHRLSAAAPALPASSGKALISLGEDEASSLGWDRWIPARETKSWLSSSLAFYTGTPLPGDVPLPPFATADSAASLRRCITETDSQRLSLLSVGARLPQGDSCSSSSGGAAQGPRSICSADVVWQGNAASLMGRTNGGKGGAALSQIDLDSFYEHDPLLDLANLNETAASAHSTECTGTRSSGVGAGELSGSETNACNDANHHEALWAAFEGGAEDQAAAGGGTAENRDRTIPAPPIGIVVGEDEESDEETSPPPRPPQHTPQTNNTCTQQNLKREEEDTEWSFSPPVS